MKNPKIVITDNREQYRAKMKIIKTFERLKKAAKQISKHHKPKNQ